MNIIEAAKTGLPFRRLGDTMFYSSPVCAAEDILADDWEVERKPREITGQMLADAMDKIQAEDNYNPPDHRYLWKGMCRELGL